MKTVFITGLTAIILLASCKQNPAGNASITEVKPAETEAAGSVVELTKLQVTKTGIQFGDFEKRNLRDVLRVNGYLHVPPQNKAQVSTFMGGVVKAVLVREGDFVHQGQALIDLAHPDFLKLQEDYLVAGSNILFSRKEYERQKELAKDNIASQKAFQEAEAKYEGEKARLASLEDQLQLLNVQVKDLSPSSLQRSFQLRSPIDGYVGKIMVNTGTFAEPQKELLTVIDNSHLHVDLMIYEKDLAKVKPGQHVNITFTNMPELVMGARIFSIGKEFENDSRTVNAHAELMGTEKHELVPGMYVNGLIETGNADAVVIPESAVIRDKGKDLIFIMDPAMQKHPAEVAFTVIEVKKGVTNGGYSEVTPLGKLPANYKVVVKGAYYVLSQMNVGKGAGCVD
ncbi:MAG: efflux RND transporter periplasmic adaptor subunit [Bacteroidota bacterium]